MYFAGRREVGCGRVSCKYRDDAKLKRTSHEARQWPLPTNLNAIIAHDATHAIRR